MPEQLAGYVPIFVALIGVGSLIVGSRVIKPASYTEVWAENRSLRNDIDALREEFETYKTERAQLAADHAQEKRESIRKLGIVVDGLEAAFAYVRVLKAAIQTAGLSVPEPSPSVQELMDRAHEIRLDI